MARATIQDEVIFSRHSTALIFGGLVGGVVSAGLGLIIGQHEGAMSALSFAALVGLAVNLLDARDDTALMRLILALIGGALMAAMIHLGFVGAPLVGAAFAGGFIGAGLSWGRTQSRARFWLGILIFALALPAGVFSAATLYPGAALALTGKFFAREALTGATWGLFLAVASGLNDLRFERDPALGALQAAISRHKLSVREYLVAARDLHLQVLRESERTDSQDARRRAGEIAQETISTQIRFADRLEELRGALHARGTEHLSQRLQELDQRIREADTPAIAGELAQVRDDVREQLRARERLKLACVRLETRLQRCVTTLEKLHLTLVQHASSQVEDLTLAASLADLEQFAQEVQFQNLSVDELCGLDDGAAPADPDEFAADPVDTLHARADRNDHESQGDPDAIEEVQRPEESAEVVFAVTQAGARCDSGEDGDHAHAAVEAHTHNARNRH